MELGGGDVYPSKIINIPNEAVGRIIGKGGTMIKQLAAQSGARIKMQKQQTLGSPTRPLTLEGSPLAISAAQGLIMEQINEAQQRANGSWNACGCHPPELRQQPERRSSLRRPHDSSGEKSGGEHPFLSPGAPRARRRKWI
ncbi:hypothetical protein T484DRAFT_1785740 [Baffinella frigidus]|nr:hypothetical protein T484DRAFT_1785740 [Cryptophyta sp. CCMP2293]